MNDSSLPPMQSQATARRLAPYLHAKLKPISAGEGLVTPTSAADEKAAEDEAAEDSGCSANRSDKKSLAVAIKAAALRAQ
jgi:hypothetical protein